MIEDRHESILVDIIHYSYKIPLRTISRMRKISTEEAMKKYISKEDYNCLVDEKIYLPNEKMSQIMNETIRWRFSLPEKLKSAFEKNKEGKYWLYSNFPGNHLENEACRKFHNQISTISPEKLLRVIH